MAEGATDLQEWKTGPKDTIAGINEIVKAVNALSKRMEALEKKIDAYSEITATVFHPESDGWRTVVVLGTLGEKAEDPPVDCVCECISGGSEEFGDA